MTLLVYADKDFSELNFENDSLWSSGNPIGDDLTWPRNPRDNISYEALLEICATHIITPSSRINDILRSIKVRSEIRVANTTIGEIPRRFSARHRRQTGGLHYHEEEPETASC